MNRTRWSISTEMKVIPLPASITKRMDCWLNFLRYSPIWIWTKITFRRRNTIQMINLMVCTLTMWMTIHLLIYKLTAILSRHCIEWMLSVHIPWTNWFIAFWVNFYDHNAVCHVFTRSAPLHLLFHSESTCCPAADVMNISIATTFPNTTFIEPLHDGPKDGILSISENLDFVHNEFDGLCFKWIGHCLCPYIWSLKNWNIIWCRVQWHWHWPFCSIQFALRIHFKYRRFRPFHYRNANLDAKLRFDVESRSKWQIRWYTHWHCGWRYIYWFTNSLSFYLCPYIPSLRNWEHTVCDEIQWMIP